MLMEIQFNIEVNPKFFKNSTSFLRVSLKIFDRFFFSSLGPTVAHGLGFLIFSVNLLLFFKPIDVRKQ